MVAGRPDTRGSRWPSYWTWISVNLLVLTSYLEVTTGQTRNLTTVNLVDGSQLRGSTVTWVGQGGQRQISSFLGIQYGAPPTGDRRYAEPEPAAHWTGQRDALRFGPSCVQALTNWASQSEDCLYLNVYSPSVNASNPVMVWFHGGGWRAGTASSAIFDGSSLATYGVVVVTVNYRLGALGFLTTDDDVMPGNYGLLDQVLALRWVQTNIRAFGGNPNSVTIFGESAGAASCSLHVLSPLSRGLFQRAIMESGSSFNLWGTERPATAVKLDTFTKQVGQAVGCRYLTSQSFLACLRHVEPRSLLQATLNLRSQLRIEIPITPRVERRFGFLPDYPKRLLERGAFNQVDTLRGFNSGEYSYFVTDPANRGVTRAGFSSMFERFFGKYPLQRHSHDFLVQLVDREYLGNLTNPIDIRSSLVNAFADMGFGLGSLLELEKMLQHGGANRGHFVYQMDYQGSRPPHPTWEGVLHAGELPWVFVGSFPPPSWSPQDQLVGDKIQTMWTNFAKTGNPVSPPVSESGTIVQWSRHGLSDRSVLRIDARSSQIPFPRLAALRGYDLFVTTLLQPGETTAGNITSTTG